MAHDGQMAGAADGAATVRAERLVIACNLNPTQVERLAAHPARPVVLPYVKDGRVWEIPPEADLLFTFFAGWRNAPATPPEGWPFRLRWIQVAAAGVDAFPPWFFAGPPVTCGRGTTAVPIAEFALAAILAHEKRFFDGTRIHARGEWRSSQLGRVEGKTLGLLGLGAIGRAVAARAAAFGIRILAVRRSAGASEPGIEMVADMATLMARSDHVVLALPLTAATRRVVGRALLAAAKPGLHLINVSRGELIDDAALIEALDSGRIGAATLDVTSPEPLPPGHPFYAHKRIRLSPHLSWSSEDGDDRLAEKLHANLDRFLRGEPLTDIVDPARGY